MDASSTKNAATHISWPSTAIVASPPPKSPRSPCSPAKTAELWDGYEKLAVEKAKERDRLTHRLSEVRDILPPQPSFDPKSRRRHTATPSTTVSFCKTCQQSVMYASGICQRCIKKVVASRETGEATPPLSPTSDTMAFTEAASPSQFASREEMITPSYSSPKRPSFCPLPAHAPTALLNRRKKSPSEPSQPNLHLDTNTSSLQTTRSQFSSPP